MKNKSIFYIVTLITSLVAFPLISGNNQPGISNEMTSRLNQSSPSFMQQCGQSLKKLTKFAFMASALLSPEIAGRSFTTSSNALPLPTLFQTPIPGDQGSITTVALNPVKREVAMAGTDILWLIDVDNPDKQDFLDIGECNYGILSLAYNDQGTKLAYSTITSLCVWDFEQKKLIGSLPEMAWAYKFNLNGTQLAVRASDDIIIWDLPTNKQTIAPVNGQEVDGTLINLERAFDKNIFMHNNNEGTVIWSLDNPSDAVTVNIGAKNRTIFGDNTKQLTFYGPAGMISGSGKSLQFINNEKSISIPVATGTDFINNLAYCSETGKYFYTISNSMVTDISVNKIDPNTFAITKLYNLINSSQAFYYLPQFNQNGDKVFIFAGGTNKTLQFVYVDLINDLKES